MLILLNLGPSTSRSRIDSGQKRHANQSFENTGETRRPPKRPFFGRRRQTIIDINSDVIGVYNNEHQVNE